MKRLEATVTGRVQGVGFRNFVWKAATGLALTGYVKNVAAGGVEVVAEGEPDQLDKLVQHLEKGPMLSRVDRVITHSAPASGGFEKFEVRYDP